MRADAARPVINSAHFDKGRGAKYLACPFPVLLSRVLLERPNAEDSTNILSKKVSNINHVADIGYGRKSMWPIL